MNRETYERCIIEHLKDLSDEALKRMFDYLNYLIIRDFRKEPANHEYRFRNTKISILEAGI